MDQTLIQLIQHIYNLEVDKLRAQDDIRRLTVELNELRKKEEQPPITEEEPKTYAYVR